MWIGTHLVARIADGPLPETWTMAMMQTGSATHRKTG
jgi:hypothetical protein